MLQYGLSVCVVKQQSHNQYRLSPGWDIAPYRVPIMPQVSTNVLEVCSTHLKNEPRSLAPSHPLHIASIGSSYVCIYFPPADPFSVSSYRTIHPGMVPTDTHSTCPHVTGYGLSEQAPDNLLQPVDIVLEFRRTC